MSNSKKLSISINLGISSAFVLLIVLTTVGLCLIMFLNLQTVLRDDLRRQIYNAVSVGSLLIDAQKHKTLSQPSQENSAEYRELKNQLIKIRQSVPDLRFVYTMRQSAKGEVIFVVDAEEDPEQISHIGDIYDSATPMLMSALQGQGSIQIEREFYTDEWGTWLSGFAPIRDKAGRLEAILGLDISAAKVSEHEFNTLIALVLVASSISVLVLLAGFFLSRRITIPLKALEQDMVRIQKFDLENGKPIKSVFREISRINEVMDNVKDSLRSFKKYVPADLVAQLIINHQKAELGGTKRDLTILFSDIEGFTTWSEKLKPEELILVLARYFSGMTRIIMRHQGTVDKFIGDAIMAFWGAPNDLQDHARHAAQAAVECLQFQIELNRQLKVEGLEPINSRIGLNSGEVLVGNVGYEDRLNYTVIGDAVNLASRLEGLNKYYRSNILLSDACASRLGNGFVLRTIDKIVVKGKTENILVHELVGSSETTSKPKRSFVGAYNDAMEVYFARDWPAALAAFEKLTSLEPKDRALIVMIERCKQFVAKDPGPSWHGAVVMREK